MDLEGALISRVPSGRRRRQEFLEAAGPTQATEIQGLRAKVAELTEKLQEALGADRCSEDRVVVQAEHKLVTSRGPGTAIEFALALAALVVLVGPSSGT